MVFGASGPVFTNFLLEFTRAAGERFDPFGKLGFFLAFDLHLFLRFDRLLGGVTLLDFSHLEGAGKLLFLGQDRLVALG